MIENFTLDLINREVDTIPLISIPEKFVSHVYCPINKTFKLYKQIYKSLYL